MTVNCVCVLDWYSNGNHWDRTVGYDTITGEMGRRAACLRSLTAPTCCSVNIYIHAVIAPTDPWPFLSGLGEHKFPSSLCNWLSFALPNSYSVFILSAFSTTTAPIVTFLLSNWQPKQSLMCRKCFITIGRAQPLIMHGNMLVEKKKEFGFSL